MRTKQLELFTRKALAQRLGKHQQTLVKWTAAGCPVAKPGRRGKPSLYDEIAVRAWLQEREEIARTAGGLLDLAQERARLAKAQAALLTQTRLARARELVPASDVEAVWAKEVTAVRNFLLSWSQLIADRVTNAAVLEGLPGVSRELDRAVREALTNLSTDHPTLRPTAIKVRRQNAPAAYRKRKRAATRPQKRSSA